MPYGAASGVDAGGVGRRHAAFTPDAKFLDRANPRLTRGAAGRYLAPMAILCPGCGREYDATLFEFGATVSCECGAEVAPFSDPRLELDQAESVEMPIDGTLDLHTFAPVDVKDLVPDYLEACREKGILRVRVVHGKGDGTLLRTVHAILDRMPGIESYALAESCEGGWGATIVVLRTGKP